MADQGSPVDERITNVENMEVYHDAEDAKTVRFTGGETTIDISITDDSMVEFLEVAEEVFDSIHADMAGLPSEFRKHDADE